MPRVTCQMSVSLDGFVAGPEQSESNPIGIGGMDLHTWHLTAADRVDQVDLAWTDEILAGNGAYVMGRNMYGPVRGEWSTQPDWHGWWGEQPPYHAPVFVLSHYEHDPIELEGGTTSTS